MKKNVTILGLTLALLFASPLLISGQTRQSPQSFGQVVSGEDLQFVVDWAEGDVVHGRLMVRIEGRWYLASPKLAPRSDLELLDNE